MKKDSFGKVTGNSPQGRLKPELCWYMINIQKGQQDTFTAEKNNYKYIKTTILF